MNIAVLVFQTCNQCTIAFGKSILNERNRVDKFTFLMMK